MKLFAAALLLLLVGCTSPDKKSGIDYDEIEVGEGRETGVQACNKATSSQRADVQLGNTRAADFLKLCKAGGVSDKWCQQLSRPNPSSVSTFKCTHPADFPHQLVHPDRSTWKHAITAGKIVQDLEKSGVCVSQIYNWWRPEPYNKNVGGAAGRHPYGTSVDVRMCKTADVNKAHAKFCALRRAGTVRAVGYYGTTSLHLGVGDKAGNTWGKSCP